MYSTCAQGFAAYVMCSIILLVVVNPFGAKYSWYMRNYRGIPIRFLLYFDP